MDSKPAKDLPDETPAQEERRQTPTPQQTDLHPPLPEDKQPADPEGREIYLNIKRQLLDPRRSLPADHPLRWAAEDIQATRDVPPMDPESIYLRVKSILEACDPEE